ncbi:MAG: hypothetical protein E4H02_04010 [Lentisphaerales bacterium]|jgi:hypothetical protein|nr:MAG: hypothetical protein E4H02_04010 [Lentisphaerales bacterium]
MRLLRCWIGCCCLLVLPMNVPAETGRPFQIGIVSPVELVEPAESINGLRLNLLYGVNQNVTGWDFGICNHTVNNHNGLQLGGVNIVGNELVGFNMGLLNFAGGRVEGSSVGLVNWAVGDLAGTQDAILLNVARSKVTYQFALGVSWGETVEGGQFGIFNRATSMTGMQVGLLNVTRSLNGLQIGVLNCAFEKEGRWKILPFVNACW